MDWKQMAADKLRQLERVRQSQRSIPLELKMLREKLADLKAVDTGKISVRGGGWSDDAMVETLAGIGELESLHMRTRQWVRMVEDALDTLEAEDRLILEELLVKKKGSVDSLCQALDMTSSGVYRRRDKALREFTLAMYGATESV